MIKYLTISMIFLALGCGRPQIPTYSSMNPSDGLELIHKRNTQIVSVQASGTITLFDSKDQSIRLNGVLLLRRPSEMRFRAWKLGQAVFDLTVNADAAYQYLPREEARSAVAPSREMLAHWQRALIGDIDPRLKPVSETSETLTLKLESDASEEWMIDRKTLTLRSIYVKDQSGNVRFELQLKDYRSFGSIVWPTRVYAIRDSGVIDIRFDEIDINSELPSSAFTPPLRAEQLP